MSKTTRKVTVDTNRRSSSEGLSTSGDFNSKTKKKSVFERLGTAGSYEGEKRTFAREGDNQYGNKYKYSQEIGSDMKKSKRGDRYLESDDGGYQDIEKSPESKRDKRKVQDGERLKIEFKKDPILKKKQTIAELYEEEVPMRKIKKEKERKEREMHSRPKSSGHDEMMVQKDEHVRNIQIKGEERKERKAKSDNRDEDDSQSEAASSKKHKRKRKMEDSDEDVGHSSKKKKKKKDKRYNSSSSESEDEREKKKKSKKDKYKTYDSDDSSSEKRKVKSHDYEDVEDKRIVTESKKKKKKKKDKYDSESDEYSEREEYSKREKTDRSYEGDKSRKSRKTGEDDIEVSKKKKSGEGKKQSSSSRKDSQKGKEKIRRSASYSSLSSGSSLGEEDIDVEYHRKSRKEKIPDKDYRDDSKKDKERRREKYEEQRSSHMHAQDTAKDMYPDERRKDILPDPHSRDHYSQGQHQEPRFEAWERDRAPYDERQQSGQYGSSHPYGRARGPDPYRGRYEPPVKGGGERDRINYRQYPDQPYGSDQARYRERGNREPYPYPHGGNRRYPGEEDAYPGGRSRDAFPGPQEAVPAYAREEKEGRGYRGEYPQSKIDHHDLDDRGRKKALHRSSREQNEYDSRSPVLKRRSHSPREGVRDDGKDRSKSRKRKREDESFEKEQALEKRGKKPKTDGKSESDIDSGSEADPKSEKARKPAEYERKEGRRVHRDSDGHQRRDDYTDEKRDRKPDQRSRDRDKDRERGKDRDRDRDRRHRPGSSGDRSRSKNQSRSEKRAESPSNEESRADKAEDKRVKALKSTHRQSSPSRRSDSESGSKSSQRRGKGQGTPQDGQSGNIDDVYEKISDDELDFFDEENSKSAKPAALEDIDWSTLAAIAPSSKKEELQEGESHRSKHSALNILKSIGFSPNLLQSGTIEIIKEKVAKFAKTNDGDDEFADLDLEKGTGALILNQMKNKRRRKNLIANLASEGTVLSMRKDINVRKELITPQNRLGMAYSLFCNAPTPVDKELFMASTSLYQKIAPGETEPSCKTIPSLVGSVIECTN